MNCLDVSSEQTANFAGVLLSLSEPLSLSVPFDQAAFQAVFRKSRDHVPDRSASSSQLNIDVAFNFTVSFAKKLLIVPNLVFDVSLSDLGFMCLKSFVLFEPFEKGQFQRCSEICEKDKSELLVDFPVP